MTRTEIFTKLAGIVVPKLDCNLVNWRGGFLSLVSDEVVTWAPKDQLRFVELCESGELYSFIQGYQMGLAKSNEITTSI